LRSLFLSVSFLKANAAGIPPNKLKIQFGYCLGCLIAAKKTFLAAVFSDLIADFRGLEQQEET
jgi:hypothetical protein